MKIKTNIRAGKQNRSGGADNNPSREDINNTVVSYVAPVSRCAGI